MKKHFYLLAVIACVLFSCKPDPVVPTVKTIAATEITEDSDGISGFTITGPNGNHIFLPAAGFISSTTCYFLDLYGYYWTSFPGTENDYGSFSLCFGIDAIDIAWYFRHAGLTIRPVSD